MATYTISGNLSPVSLVNTDSTIVMANAPGNANYYQGTVNLDGTYSIPSLPDATTYKVQVTGSNFLTSVASITVPISGANVTGIDFIAVLAPSVGIFAPMFSDSFQRANELPLSDGGNWINLGSLPTKDQLQILNNQCETTVTVSRDGTAYYRDTGIVLPNDQYCSVTITELGINGLIWLYVRGTDGASTPALEQNYNVFIYGGGGGGSAFSVSAIDTGGSIFHMCGSDISRIYFPLTMLSHLPSLDKGLSLLSICSRTVHVFGRQWLHQILTVYMLQAP